MRRLGLAMASMILVTGVGACGDRDDLRDEVLGYVSQSARSSARYVYVDERFDDPISDQRGRRIEVQGLREDDFRFKARVLFDDAEGFDEVVSDDALAMRFIEPNRLSAFVNKEKLAEVDLETDREGVGVLDALRSRRWVTDDSAAPSLTVGERKLEEIGVDPVLDALTGLQYVEAAIREAAGVNEYSPDDLSPAYNNSEDTFPKPADGSSVTRYDLIRPPLPPAVNRSGRDESSLPGTRHFRRMAIYVQDDRVIRVLEEIDLRGKKLDDFIKYNRAALKANDVPEQVREQFEAGVEQRPDDPQQEVAFGRAVLSGLNMTLNGLGVDPILIRSMSLEFRDLGGDVKVELPRDDVIRGDLDFLIVTDRGKSASAAGGAGGTTTTTTAAPIASPAAAPVEPTPPASP